MPTTSIKGHTRSRRVGALRFGGFRLPLGKQAQRGKWCHPETPPSDGPSREPLSDCALPNPEKDPDVDACLEKWGRYREVGFTLEGLHGKKLGNALDCDVTNDETNDEMTRDERR